MNQGARTFLLTGLVIFILLVMHMLPTINVGSVTLRNVNILNDVIPEELQEADDTIDVVPQTATGNPLLTEEHQNIRQEVPEGVIPIDDYSEGRPGGMAHFYEVLSRVESMGRPVRIAYYSDSFVEGDIMTCDLREMLQERFGGNGVGWIDCGSEISGFRRSIDQHSSGIKGYEVMRKPFSHRLEGISQRYFLPEKRVVMAASGTNYKQHASQWQVSQMFLRTSQPAVLSMSKNGGAASAVRVDSSRRVQMVPMHERADVRSVRCRIDSCGHDIQLFGMALESAEGVVLDNLSMRGSMGNTLAYIPQQTLDDFARLRPYDLIVLHFGLNVINEHSRTSNYKAYVQQMKKVVSHFRASFPEASILVVSVSDRDQRRMGSIRTMQGVETLVAYQQLLAAECGVGFYNLFQAMGGRESMKKMVEHGWANKDYTHLSFAGGKQVAGYFFDSMMAGMRNYELNAQRQR